MRNLTLAIVLLITSSLSAAELPEWMAGTWRAESDGTQMEEHWTSAAGGMMLGLHRDVRPNGKGFFEFLRIQQKDGVVTYLAMPGGKPATAFPLKSMTDSKVVFENLQHDFPQRIIYWRDGAQLCARVEGKMKEKEESESWCWVKVK